jgi:hypothetical protein
LTGPGGVGGTLIFTRGDTSQLSCNDTFGPSPLTPGTYALSSSGPPGLYTMVIPLAPDPKASPVNASSGSMLVPSADGKRADVIETDNGALNITICNSPAITSMVLRGHLTKLDGDGNED